MYHLVFSEVLDGARKYSRLAGDDGDIDDGYIERRFQSYTWKIEH